MRKLYAIRWEATTKETWGTTACLQSFLSPSREPDRIFTGSSKEFVKSCQDLQGDHDTSTPHRSDTNGMADRAVRRAKEGTKVFVRSSCLSDHWWDCTMEGCCYLRNGIWPKTAFGKRCWQAIRRTDLSFRIIG